MKPRTAKPTRGRPSILSPKLTSEISSWVERGNTLGTAARLCGIASSTAYAWLEQGDRDGTGPHFEFSERIARARARAESAMVKVLWDVALGKIADKSYNQLRAATEWLSRRAPQEWGRVERALPPPPADNKPIGVMIVAAEDEDKKMYDFKIRDANELDYPSGTGNTRSSKGQAG